MAFQKFKAWYVGLILTALALLLAFSFAGWADSNDELTQIRQAIKAKGAKWEAGETSVFRLPPAERIKRLGLRKPTKLEAEEFAAALLPERTGEFAEAAPATLDWRNFSGDGTRPPGSYVTGIRDQGNCGSCWAFATTAALESNVLLTDKTPNQECNFAEQVLVSCSGAGDCKGGYISGASYYIRDIGLPVESCFPYTATNNNCGNACSTYQTSTAVIDSWHYVATTAPTVTALKDALVAYGPLVTTMEVYSDFYSYKSGIYSVTAFGTYQGGHAVLIVGYNDLGQYFIVKNSWGADWGESGYFRIAYSELASKTEFGNFTIAYVGEGSPAPVPPTCSFTISPTAKTFKTRGGTGTVSVATQSGCAWTAASNAPDWIQIKSGALGTGSGKVTYSVLPNSGPARQGTMTIASQTFTVKQAGVRLRTPIVR